MSEGLPYFCCDSRRRAALRAAPAGVNGIDFVEVLDADAPSPSLRQRILLVHFVKKSPLPAVTAAAVTITGGERIPEVTVTRTEMDVTIGVLSVEVAGPGDFSTYTLRIAEPAATATLDPLLAAVQFSFKVECASELDCQPACGCAPEERAEPQIDYLAKDYASLRRLILDRMALIAPGWTERNPADLGVTLAELVAYEGDHLSYQQDSVATEAYLGTARRRSSVRRHATLLDYRVSDGCNARTWMHVPADTGGTLPAGTPLVTRLPGAGDVIAPGELARRMGERPEVFETMHDLDLDPLRNEIRLYAWGERECCLPEGATRATLQDAPKLLRGDLLLLEEVRGPRTGKTADADRRRRHVVRLTRDAEPIAAADPLAPAVQVSEIAWGDEDALPFALCLSARTDSGEYVEDVSVARGNMVLADHGRSVHDDEWPGVVPQPSAALTVRATGCGPCSEREDLAPPARFRPSLHAGPVTQVAHVARTGTVEGRRERLAFDPDGAATTAYRFAVERVLPAIRLVDDVGRGWHPQPDLLSSDASQLEFVLETEDDGRASVRFGDGDNGEAPVPGRRFEADYRIGNGVAGNVGAEAIAHVVIEQGSAVGSGVRNPLPARGGVDPESLERTRQDAPVAFRRPERAVTADDYARMAERAIEVQRAQATLRWTGSWRTVFLTIDRVGGRPVDVDFEARLRDHLERYRLAGHDLEIDGPRYVDLELELEVCVDGDYFRSDVARALRELLGSRTLPDGRRGSFHPDRLTFDQDVRLGPIVAAAQSVPGVREVRPTVFRRLGERGDGGLAAGVVAIGRLEIARLADDPNFPDRGALRLRVSGGR